MVCDRVLVIGGYGFFGRRLVQRLSRWPDLEIVIAGRSQARCQALVDELQPQALARLRGAQLDVNAPGFAADLAALHADAVVHTSGPFQGQDYRVAHACVAAGAHYIDLADGREFVAGIGALDDAARARGVTVVSGASSVPALSCAAADALAHDLARVDRVDIGISPGNRTERGLATVRAILGYCGKALPAAGASTRFGWCGTWRHAYPAPVGRRLLSPCDVPDLALLSGRYPGHPAVRFGAGLELAFLHRGMTALALLTRAGLVADWSRHAPLLKRIADWFRRLGTDAGAMHVSVSGSTASGGRCTRRWQLVATHGDGPFVPTLAAAALLHQWRQGRAALAGARPCIGLLSLQDFSNACQGLHIDMGDAPAGASSSLYERVLGDDYARLPAAVQRFHRLAGQHLLHGHVQTEAPASLPARLLALCLGTPRRAHRGALRFALDANPDAEAWTRHFPTQTMTSRMRLVSGSLQETLGAARLSFGLSVAGDTLKMELKGLHFLGVPCPRWLMPRIVAEERGSGDRLHFRIAARVPLLGTVAGYHGHLDLGPQEPRQ